MKKKNSQFWMAFIETNKAIFFRKWNSKSDFRSSTWEMVLLVNIVSCMNDAIVGGLI